MEERWRKKVAGVVGQVARQYGLSLKWSGDTCLIAHLDTSINLGFLSKRRIEIYDSFTNRISCKLWELDYTIMNALRSQYYQGLT